MMGGAFGSRGESGGERAAGVFGVVGGTGEEGGVEDGLMSLGVEGASSGGVSALCCLINWDDDRHRLNQGGVDRQLSGTG
jgi:hypothetical protein